MIVIDTSALIRFLTRDIPSKAQKVKTVLESESVFIPDVVFPELEYVLLGKTYNTTRKDIVKAFQYLVNKKNIKTSKEAKLALKLYEEGGLDFADCLIIASSKGRKLLSFDNKMLKLSKTL